MARLHVVVCDAVLAAELAVQVAPDHHAVVRPRCLLLFIKAPQTRGLAASAELRLPALGREGLVDAAEAARERAARDGLLLLRRLVRFDLYGRGGSSEMQALRCSGDGCVHAHDQLMV